MKRAASKKMARKSKKAASGKKAASKVTGKPIAMLSNGIFVIQTKPRKPPKARPFDSAGALLNRLGDALSKPGLSRSAVFGGTPSKRVYSYYVDESNPSRMIRESFDGTRTSGRVVDGKFRAG